MKFIILISLLLFLFWSCEESSFIPKPPTYLRLELPAHEYELYDDSCAYTFELSKMFTVTKAPSENGSDCHKRIDLGPLNGVAYLRYWKIGEQPLSFFVNGANDEVERHKLKATNIEDENYLRPKDRVYGTMFSLEGNVATPFQFYLTDSVSNFIYCEVLFNSAPNFDSLKPSLDYLKVDLDHMVKTIKWKN